MEGGSPDPDSVLDVEPVVRYYRAMDRGPYGLKEALKKANDADENSTERIILTQGRLAFTAYFASEKATRANHGFAGKTELTELLRILWRQRPNIQSDWAARLAAAMSAMEGLPGEIEAVSGSRQTSKRRRLQDSDEGPVPRTTTTNGAIGGSANSVHHMPSPPEHVFIGAPLELAEDLFQEDFWESIERISDQHHAGRMLADISMIFPPEGSIRERFGCQMEIGIAQERTAEIAYKCFGVTIETKDGFRSVRYPGGGKIEPDPSMTLRACRQDHSSRFRGVMYEAVCASPIYQREKSEVRRRTDGVSMTISNQANEGARFTVFMGDWMATKIKDRFYG